MLNRIAKWLCDTFMLLTMDREKLSRLVELSDAKLNREPEGGFYDSEKIYIDTGIVRAPLEGTVVTMQLASDEGVVLYVKRPMQFLAE